MVWTTVANPGMATQRRNKRRITLDSLSTNNPWSMGIDNLNMIQQVYRGRYDRQERYRMYDWMDNDSDVNRALDMIAEHCTKKNQDGDFFDLDWEIEDPTEEISQILKETLKAWGRMNEWDKRMMRRVRNVIKYGDWFYYRNPQTLELFNIHPKHVMGALIDRATNEVLAWIVRNFKFNVENLEITVDRKRLQDTIKNLSTTGIRNTKVIPATHIVHLTMSEGRFAGSTSDDDPMDRYRNRWPFGESWLEQIYKVFKQRELLEDANIIHRVQRAPSRNVWYIDVGKTRPDRATGIMNRFKNELNQTRIPQFIGTEQKTVDSVYSPISQLQDYYIPVSMDQRGSKVELLEGQPWDRTPDLDYFKKKFLSALRVPYAWMLGSQEGGSMINNGRAGVAYQEEIEFSRVCTRFHNLFIGAFDLEFKIYCKVRDVNVNAADFKLAFVPPDDYEESSRSARLQESRAVWSTFKDEPYMSYRFALEKFAGLTPDEILEMERMVIEENHPGEDAEERLSRGGGMGGGGALGGFGAPPGGLTPGAPALSAGVGDMGGAVPGGGSATGADFAGGNLGGAGGGGMGESEKEKAKRMLVERIVARHNKNPIREPRTKPKLVEAITMQDIEPAPENYDNSDLETTPDDKLVLNPTDGFLQKPVATLEMLSKLRHSHMARRVEQAKRLKQIQKIYKKPMNPDAMGGAGGGIPGL